MQDEEERSPRPVSRADTPTVDEVADSLRRKQKLEGARKSYQENCESMQRVHVSPRLGAVAITDVTTAHVEALASAMLSDGRAPKTVRNVVSFLHSILEHSIDVAGRVRTRRAAPRDPVAGGRATSTRTCSS